MNYPPMVEWCVDESSAISERQHDNCVTKKIYTGIGHRQIPEEIFALFKKISTELAKRGFILRSGGAVGADSAFEEGCDSAKGKKEIYLPWRNFNNNPSLLYDVSTQCVAYAREIIPNFKNMKSGTQLLTARNIYQIMGQDLKTPTDLVICYCSRNGGTANALKMAKYFDIKMIINCYDYINDLLTAEHVIFEYLMTL